MSKTILVLAVVACLAGSAAFADQPVLVGPSFQRTVALQPTLQPIPQPESTVIQSSATVGEPITLFACVKVRDEKKIACKSVPMIVSVKDPCAEQDKCKCLFKCLCKCPCERTPPKCVNVQICVPACSECPPKVTCRKDGGYVKYDFGTSSVVVRSKKGFVEVDYN